MECTHRIDGAHIHGVLCISVAVFTMRHLSKGMMTVCGTLISVFTLPCSRYETGEAINDTKVEKLQTRSVHIS